jgi:hypothetical protein
MHEGLKAGGPSMGAMPSLITKQKMLRLRTVFVAFCSRLLGLQSEQYWDLDSTFFPNKLLLENQ